MRNPPDGKYDLELWADMKAEPWMIDLLKMNPDYNAWGSDEDCQYDTGDDWTSRVLVDRWKVLNFRPLDDYNEVVNFYFELERPSKECAACGGTGEHPDAQWVALSFYRHSSPFTTPDDGERGARAIMSRFAGGGPGRGGVVGRGTFPSAAVLAKYGPEFRSFCEGLRNGPGYWSDSLDAGDRKALKDADRTVGVVGIVDAISRGIMVEARCKRYGLPCLCETCEGRANTYTADACHVRLVLWVIHPRKGCSRGVRVERIEQSELPEVFAYLRSAAARNADRFSKIPPK